ncbi:MarR family transcriptional regulator [Leisingera sp. ANG-M1]|uniref:MarR family winged helix-turn-helix transcriptional regulator n=1 Tax=Leisingera sp. ANG-M1 TaxID=1577895 RepID=UPI00057E2F02|nr:MarR family transcriptional regulator [Leisingera sp. ANG-M1]KIC11508.1 MarR family transcriptional regulator [Leisingera sp. ANG-M1]
MTKTLDQLYEAVQATRPLMRGITAAVEQGTLPHGISLGQRALLEGLLNRPGATAPQLGQDLQLKRQFVSRILKELRQAALIEASPSPARKGSSCYCLKPRGTEIIREIRARETAVLQRFASDFSDEDIATHHRVQLALTHFFMTQAQEA